MRKKQIVAIVLCIIIIFLTIIRFLIDNATPIGIIIRIMWITSGVIATILAIMHLIKFKQRNDKHK